MKDIFVIGAGISGLVCALYAKRAGLSVAVAEHQLHSGGAISSQCERQFLLELGPNSTLSKPSIVKLIQDLGLSSEMIFPPVTARKRFLVLENQGRQWLEPAPMSLTQALTTPILSARGKLRVLREPFVKKTSIADETVYDFMTRRFGKECAERIVAPVLTGIWAGDITKLSCRTALPTVWSIEQEFGTLSIGGLRYLRARRKRGEPRAKIMSLRGGLTVLVQRLQEELGNDLHCEEVERIEVREEGLKIVTNLQTFEARKVVIAVAADAAAKLVEQVSAPLARALRTIPYSPIGVLHLGFRREHVNHPLDGFGFLWAPQSGRALLGALFSSSMFEGRAPDGWHLLTCLCGGGVNPELADVRKEEIREQAIRDVSRLIGSRHRPEILRETYWERAIPSYPLGHGRLQQVVGEFEAEYPRFRFLGNWRAGISIADCSAAAMQLAESLAGPASGSEVSGR